MWRLRHTHAGGGGGSQRELRAIVREASSMRIRLNREIQPMSNKNEGKCPVQKQSVQSPSTHTPWSPRPVELLRTIYSGNI